MQNGDILEEAYADAFKADGSAQRELETYLESIQGHIDIFNNSVQTMWMNFMSSDAIKWFVHFGTMLVKAVDNIGLFETALMGVLVYLTKIKKHDPFIMFKNFKEAQVKSNKASGTIGAIQSLNGLGGASADKTAFNAANINAYAAAVKNLTEAEQAAKLAEAGLNQAQIDAALARNGVTDASVRQKLVEDALAATKTKATAVTVAEAFAIDEEKRKTLDGAAADWLAANGSARLTAELVKQAVLHGVITEEQGAEIIATYGLTAANHGAAFSFKALGTAIKTAFMSNPVGWIMTLVSGIVMIANCAKAAKEETEDFSQQAEQLKSEFNSVTGTISDNIRTLKGLEDEFESLAACVDDYGNNISLSADDYARYQEIVSSIIDMSPELIAGYDAEGNAIVNKNALIERTIELLEEEQMLEARRFSSGDSWRTLIEGLQQDIANAPSKDQTKENFANELSNVFKDNQSIWNIVGLGTGDDAGIVGYLNFLHDLELGEWTWRQEDASKTNSIPIIGAAGNWLDTKVRGEQMEKEIEEHTIEILEAMKEHEADIVGKYMEKDQFESLMAYLSEYHHANSVKEAIKQYQDEYVDLLYSAAQSDESFYDLSEQQRNWLKQYIDAAFPIPTDGDVEGSIHDAKEKLLKFVDDFANDSDLQDAFSRASNLALGKDFDGNIIDIEDYEKEYESFISSLKDSGHDEELINAFSTLAQPENYDEAMDHLVRLFATQEEINEAVRLYTADVALGVATSDPYSYLADSKEIYKALESMSMSDLMFAYQITAEPGSMTFEELRDAIADMKKELGVSVTPAKTYTAITEEMTEYIDALSQTSEIISDDIAVTQEYKDALIGLGISEKELNECFYEGNSLLVKDAKALNKLVDAAKDSTVQNIKLAKSYARIEYRDLYNEMKSLTNGTKVTDGATRDYIDSLYDQMRAIQRTIGKYSLLEAELLGAANAYKELEAAQTADEAADYGSKAEELVNILAEAFNTAQLGTESARVAIEGLIPDDVIDKSKTLNEQMQQIYDYFTKGEVSQLFTIEFNDDGAIESVEMTKENVQAFTESLIGTDDDSVFQGTWDEFTLNPAIQTLEDFAKACGITEEVAFAFLTELEKYDIGNVLGGGNDSLLDQLMGDNLDYQLQKAIQTAAEVEKKLAEGALSANSQEYQDAQKKLEELEEQTMSDAATWATKQQALKEQKETLMDLKRRYEEAYKAGEDTSEIEEAIEDTSKAIDILVGDLKELDEPTEFVLEVAISEAQENIAELRKDLDALADEDNDRAVVIEAILGTIDTEGLDGLEEMGFIKGEDGVWSGSAKIEGWTKLDPASKQQVLEYINTIEKEHQISLVLGEDTPTIEEHLDTIAKILEDIAKILDPTYTLTVDTSDAETKTETFKSMWEGIKSKEVTLTTFVNEIKSFFTRTPDEGDGEVNGNAHFGGGAYVGGTVGAKNTETSLVGELGPELVVRGNRWFTVGENGASFETIKRGDIIFNHKQTAELLKNGHIAGRGKAYASGTAYAFNSFSGASGINTWDKAYNMVPVDWSNQPSGELDTFDDKVGEATENLTDAMDWIAVRMQEYAERIDKINSLLDTAVGSTEKNNLIDQLINETSQKKRDSSKAAKAYEEKANGYLAGLNSDLKYKAQNGTISIEDIEALYGEDVAEAIQNYREYSELAAEAEADAIKANAEIADLAKQKFDNIAADYEHTIGLAEELYKQEEALIDLHDGQTDTTSYYDNLISQRAAIRDELQNERNALAAQLQYELDHGTIQYDSDQYREMVSEIEALDTEIIQCGVDLEDLALDKLDAVATKYEHITGLVGDTIDALQAQVDLQEELGEIASPEYYEKMIAESEKMYQTLLDQKTAMQAVLDEQVALGNIKVGSEEWYEMVQSINEVDASIVECETNIESFKNAINDIYWDNFDELINRINYVKEETQSIIDLMSDADMVTTPDSEDGWGAMDVRWTEEGLATLAMYAQQMEIAEYTAKEYAAQIDELKKQYDEGKYSETEYLEKLNELKEAQYESIEAYQDAKDAIVELNEARVESIKEGIEKEVEAYEELINKKKEALDAEKDLYDFQKSVEEQSKNIADIERKLAALAVDNSASARAQRAKLEAELAEAKAELDEQYYDRSISDQQDALDKELEDFQTQKDAEIAKWEEYLTNVEAIVAESLFNIQANADIVYATLEEKAAAYDLTLSDHIKSPWEEAAAQAMAFSAVYDALEAEANAYGMTLAQFLSTPWTEAKDSPVYQELFDKLSAIADQYGLDLKTDIIDAWSAGEGAIDSYDGVFGDSASSTIEQLDNIKSAWQAVIDKINEAANAVGGYNGAVNGNGNTDGDNATGGGNTGNNTDNGGGTTSTPNRTTDEYNGVALAIWNGNYGWGNGDTRIQRLKAKGFDPVRIQQIVNEMGRAGNVHNGSWMAKYGIKDLSKYHFNKFAKGSTGVKKDQLAIIDELGEELQLVPGRNGRLEYVKKGTGIIPADVTSNLMAWGELDPQDMLDRNRPQIIAPHIVNNEINIDCSVGALVNIERCDQNTLPDVEKMINKAFDKHMQTLNNSLKRYAR